MKDDSREILDESLDILGQSPIKLHSLPKHRRLAYASTKFEATVDLFKQSFAEAIGVQQDDLPILNKSEVDVTHDMITKANDLDKLMEQIRDKVSIAPYNEKMQILTLIPESWTIKKASCYFKVSEYLVKRARDLKNQKGILASPERRKGKMLPNEVVETVKLFFEDDEVSRLMPGKKDFVSIGRNIHKQKRLLLCNLKELYALLIAQYPAVKIGLSRFCSLRPKWCVTVGSSGTHSVCVCV